MPPSLGIESGESGISLPIKRKKLGTAGEQAVPIINSQFSILNSQFSIRKIKAVRILIFLPSFPPKIPQSFHTAVQLFPQVTASFPQVTASFPQV
ncbi:MAG: hypothetical protein F6K31_11570 [Symploca sp. SIO2G7]|nr:hypothetical protein [Symploca sp. SIO2G7]